MLRRILTILLAASCFLPIAELVLFGLGRLLAALGDAAGAMVLDRLCLSGGVLWILTLVGLLLALAIQALAPPDPRS